MTPHYHSCPECYEHYPCLMDCTIEPDLSKDGREFGAHCICDSCIVTKYPQLNRMLKGWERVSKLLGGPHSYMNSTENYHCFVAISNGIVKSIEIEDGDFDLDFDKYNGFK